MSKSLTAYLGFLLGFVLQALGAATWQNISVSTNPVTYTIITNVMGFTGSTTTYLRSDGTQATPAGTGAYAVTNYFITPSTGITVSTNVTGTNVTWTLSSTVVSGGNMTNAGPAPAVVGMVPVATDTTGTQWTPTNSISLNDVVAGTLSLSNMLANVIPGFDSNTNMVPTSMTTNVLSLLYTESNNLTNWGKLATNSFQGASTTLDHYAGTDTNALLSALGGAALAGATFTGNLAVTGTNVIGALAGKQAASAVLDHYAGTDTNAILAAIGGQPLSANLTLLSSYGPTTWQATNAALTALAGNPSLYQATNAALTALAGNPSLYQATNASLTALAGDPNLYQATNSVLTHYQGTDTNAILAAIGGAALAGATFTGDLAVTGTNVIGALALKAPLASPAITGAPTINGVGIQQPVSALTTTWTAANSASNYVADLSLRGLLFNMTTNLNIIHTTNGTANFTANTITNYMSIKVINNSGTNFPVSWPATWHSLGTWASGFTLTNGDFCSIAIEFAGPSADQTNNWIGVAYKQY